MYRQPKKSFIDQQEIASHFVEGQIVMHVDPLRFRQAPYKGVVEKVHRGIGQVDVRFPFGVKRLAPENLIPAGDVVGKDEPLDYPSEDWIRITMPIKSSHPFYLTWKSVGRLRRQCIGRVRVGAMPQPQAS